MPDEKEENSNAAGRSYDKPVCSLMSSVTINAQYYVHSFDLSLHLPYIDVDP